MRGEDDAPPGDPPATVGQDERPADPVEHAHTGEALERATRRGAVRKRDAAGHRSGRPLEAGEGEQLGRPARRRRGERGGCDERGDHWLYDAGVIDIKAARYDPEGFRAALARRGAAEELDRLLEVDARWRELTDRVGGLRARQKKPKGKPTPEEIEELKGLKAELQAAESELAEADAERRRLLDVIPNLPDPDAPDGWTEEDAVAIRHWGEAREVDVRDPLELGSPTGWIDMERGARVSGSRFAYRFGDVALLELSLYRFALERLAEKGFVPVLPPVLVREEAMYGTGFLPTDEVNIYRVERDDLYLTGTSEVTLAAIHMGEELDEAELPRQYTAFSTNFRREAGAAGKDTRGMFRVHQFDKVEMFVFCLPEESRDWHERLLAQEEEIVQELGLPYRVMNIAVGDLGASATKKYDIEAWFPSQERYREITSCSNTTDYQARRLEIRFRRDGKLEPVHTLNGTAVTARAMLAIMENFQDDGGEVVVPDVLVERGAPKRLGSLSGVA
jgi:seryl-tRNA synthetase